MGKIAGAHLTDAETEVKPAGNLGPLGKTKTFTYTITPLEAGPLQVPQIEFCYFDPTAKIYKTEKSGPFNLQVLRSAETTTRTLLSSSIPAAEKGGHVDVVGDDILPLIAEPGRLRPRHIPKPIVPAAAAAPAVGYVGLALFLRRKRRLEQDPRYARDYFARSKTEKRLGQVLDSPEPTEELYRAVSEFIADKLNLAASGITSSDAREALQARGISAELIETFSKVLRACERARYASVQLSRDEAIALVQAASAGIGQLERELKKSSSNGRTA